MQWRLRLHPTPCRLLAWQAALQRPAIVMGVRYRIVAQRFLQRQRQQVVRLRMHVHASFLVLAVHRIQMAVRVMPHRRNHRLRHRRRLACRRLAVVLPLVPAIVAVQRLPLQVPIRNRVLCPWSPVPALRCFHIRAAGKATATIGMRHLRQWRQSM